jgi:ATP-dependent protease ClpP protease subunit
MQTIELYGEIGEDYSASLDYFTYRFNEMRREHPSDSILVKINSEGGCLKEGLAIANTIELDGNTDTLNMGLAGSVAGLILLKGRRRFSASSSVTMFHKAFFEDDDDNTSDKQVILDTYNTEIIKLLVSKTKLGNPEAIDGLLSGMGLWLDSAQALKAGVIDQILYSENSLPDAKNRIDKLVLKCKSTVLNKIPKNKELDDMPLSPEDLKALSASIAEGNKPLIDEISGLKNQVAELVKNSANAPALNDVVKSVVAEAVAPVLTPVMNDASELLKSVKAQSEGLTNIVNSLKNMPAPNQQTPLPVWGAVDNTSVEGKFIS